MKFEIKIKKAKEVTWIIPFLSIWIIGWIIIPLRDYISLELSQLIYFFSFLIIWSLFTFKFRRLK
jgi:hypothetical protein